MFWYERVRLAVESWQRWSELPDHARMDRVLKESGVRDLVMNLLDKVKELEEEYEYVCEHKWRDYEGIGTVCRDCGAPKPTEGDDTPGLDDARAFLSSFSHFSPKNCMCAACKAVMAIDEAVKKEATD